MGGGLAFLNKKSWHTQSHQNMEKKWIKEQAHKKYEKEQAERAMERNREQNRYEQKVAMLKSGKDKQLARLQMEVNFMYEPPPGLEEMLKKQQEQQNAQEKSEQNAAGQPKPKWVEEIEAGTGIPQPMGVLLRKVKCVRCRQWGHQAGDRECPMANINPADTIAKLMEDPLTYVNQTMEAPGGKYELKNTDRPVDKEDPINQLVPVTEAELFFEDVAQQEQWITSLSKKEKKKLKKAIAELEKKSKKHKKEKKKEMKEKRKEDDSKKRKDR
eukprot:TRINITY_DN8094_c0_g1::TRINITY_DN8094_c0_g1_i1::g.20211::m.20211 TRINITY_DN8094_c0_g1::TRINITY_DN8094_c0_g1_i1::g.20211  ORF type:complete len:271 (+),score=49.29,sp/Q8VZ67/Y4919_ARATH/30.94/6e-22,Cir_N/PF10197.4/1.7e-06,Cir_N/PF10197.4/8.4e+03,Cir_N/PF10197.4/1.5e+04,zf-CCHC_6/PF15288.1/4.8e+03,zf-CCHC_6/PF15288.1/0.00013 TRINITY_DN8094_c0_g1_i1:110-922(+)